MTQAASELEYPAILASAAFDINLGDAASHVNDVAKNAATEATISTSLAIQLGMLLKTHFGISHSPDQELSLSTRLVARGRIDSSYGALIIEFKRPTTLRTSTQRALAEAQLESYLEARWKAAGQNYLGLLTDGVQARFVRIEHGVFKRESYTPFNADVLRRMVRIVLSLDKVALSSANLVRDFCQPASTSIYRRLARELYSSLVSAPSEKTQMLYGEWRELFRLAHEDSTKQAAIAARKKSLVEVFGSSADKNADEYQMLYALQTTYAILVKLIAFKVVRDVYFQSPIATFSDLQALPAPALRKAMIDLEGGSTFRAAGVLNLLEGDFFSWYTEETQWSAQMAALVQEALTILAKYEDQFLSQEFSITRDLFRELYERVIPGPVRHSMGEFYTPPWLADLLVSEALSRVQTDDWRALDPCAGSGTFVTRLIDQVLTQTSAQPRSQRLAAVLDRVMAIDLNPLAVLTTRVNYFVNIAPLVVTSDEILIPVFLGDSSYVASEVQIADVTCYEYQIQTLKGPLKIILPRSALHDPQRFSTTMTEVEREIKRLRQHRVLELLEGLCDPADLNPGVVAELSSLSCRLVELERLGWNGIWARIVTNFLSTAAMPRFDLIVGNPPWIDWKNLPAGYRERIKGICIDRQLFSGDRITGGINLNICALIANVAADKWLSADGTLAFLMPENILFQQTYEGFRRFYLVTEATRLYLQEILDFTKAGHPFKPVQYPFHAYLFARPVKDYADGIDVQMFVKRPGSPRIETVNSAQQFAEVDTYFERVSRVAGTTSEQLSAFTYAPSRPALHLFRRVAGSCEYVGREGIEFYPQELLLLELLDDVAPEGNVWVTNFQNPGRSKYPLPPTQVLLETRFLHPLVKGIEIEQDVIRPPRFVVPFPYGDESVRLPIPMDVLWTESPRLANYLTEHKDVLEAQTGYNTSIIGTSDHEFHALARVGAYSFRDVHVAYRDNSRWCAAVASPLLMPWGEYKRPLFQNHAPSICERTDRTYISETEAYYVAGIFNTTAVREFVMNSSDSRTFRVRPNVFTPLFDPQNSLMVRMADTSRVVAERVRQGLDPTTERGEVEDAYLELLASRW